MRRVGFAAVRKRDGEHGDLQILPHLVPEGRHADIGGLERGDPEQFLDAVLNLALVGGGGRALFQQQLLGHPLVHAGIRRKARASMTRVDSSFACRLRQHDEEGHHLEVVDALKLALHGVGAARGEQAGDGALLFLADDGGDGLGEQVLRGAHVLAVLGRLVEAGAGPGVGQVAPDAEPFQAVENLLGLGERQQDRAVVAHMHEVVRRERVARLDGLQRRLALGTQAEDDARRDGGFAAILRGGDGATCRAAGSPASRDVP